MFKKVFGGKYFKLKIAKKIKVAAVIISAASILLSGNVFAYTRQKTEIYGGYNIPILTYVIAPSRHLTLLKKFRRKNIAVLSALKRLQTIIGKHNGLHKTANKKYTAYGFNFNSYKITPFVAGRLNYIKNLIRSKNIKVLSIAGYTDSIGTKAYNDKLALERAKSAEKYFGLKNIKLYGLGKCCYISKYNFKNRRVVIKTKIK